MKTLCIYHGNCDDGFAAAWCVRHALGDDKVEFYPGVYQEPPPDVTDRYVVMVDFSYKRPVLEEMAAKARSIVILDHHKTAAEDLADFPLASPKDPVGPGIVALFDMTRSGAGLAWDFFHTDEEGAELPRPEFINYIEDRDLWKKKLANGDEFTIALRSYPQDFEVWDRLVINGVGPLIAEGMSIQRYYRRRIEELKSDSYTANFYVEGPSGGDHDEGVLLDETVPVCNAPYFAASEVAGELAEGQAFAACFFQRADGKWQYSLRSRDGGADVSAIAKLFGGGGHAAAAGFAVDKPVHTRV